MSDPRDARRTPVRRGRGRVGGRIMSAGLSDPGGAGTDDRIAELEARLARLESIPRLRDRGRSMMDKVLPPEASRHFRNAGREQLLGVRAIVDFWLRRIDAADARSSEPRGDERETIEIQ